MKPGELPALSIKHGVQALQFLQDDERQLVQVRVQGFSFNRLAPYTSLDDYLPEIKRTWGLYVDLVKPVQVRQIRVRYINRILLPMTERRSRFRPLLHRLRRTYRMKTGWNWWAFSTSMLPLRLQRETKSVRC